MDPAQDGSSSITSSASPSPCVLAEQPQDILLAIMDLLPNSSIISLSVTHKDLYKAVQMFHRGKMALQNRDVTEFLIALQRDLPYTFRCPACRKLCRLNPKGTWKDQKHHNCSGSHYWQWWDWCSTQRRYSSSDIRRLLWHPCVRDAKINFMDAYLAMDRHFLGSLYGLPLHKLERHVAFENYILLTDTMDFRAVDWDDRQEMQRRRQRQDSFKKGIFKRKPNRSTDPCFERPWKFSYDYVPKIIDDELYIGRFNRINGPMVTWRQFAALLGSINLPICHHLEVVPEFTGDILVQHTDRTAVFSYVMCNDEVFDQDGSCPDCFTDWELKVKVDKCTREWSVRLSTYHCLGSCRSPNDASWSRLRGGNSPSNNVVDENEEESDGAEEGRAQRKWYKRLHQEYVAGLL